MSRTAKKLRAFLAHQQRAFEYARMRARVALFMEMRLGKTLVAIRWAVDRKLKRVLVIAPNSCLFSWQDELELEGIKSVVLQGTQDQRARLIVDEWRKNRACWFLLNYESTFQRGTGKRTYPNDLLKVDYDAVILDESRRIANPQSRTTKAIHDGLRHIDNRMLLCGLPAPEGPHEYVSQLSFTNSTGKFMGCKNKWEFQDRYYEVGRNTWDLYPAPGTLKLVKEAVKENTFCLSRQESKIGSTMFDERRTVELPAKLRRIYDEIESDFCSGDWETKWTVVQRMQLFRILGGYPLDFQESISHHKTKEIVDLLAGELKHEPILVWFKFNEEIAQVEQYLKSKKYKVVSVSGKDKLKERHEKRKACFSGKYQILLSQIKVGMVGIDYSFSDTCIYFSRSESLDERLQSRDRLQHPAKTSPKLCIDLVVRDSLDEDLLESLCEKRTKSRDVFMAVYYKKAMKRLRGKHAKV